MLFGVAAGCRPAVVRVPVSREDQQRANVLAGEGDVVFARKEYWPALLKYQDAVLIDPNNHVIYNKLGITCSRLRFFDLAISAFNRSIGLDPKYSYSYNNLGSVFFALNNKKKAGEYFRKAIELKYDEASFHINMGTLLFENKKYEKGLRELRVGLDLDPEILKKTESVSITAPTSRENTQEKSYFMARLYASVGNAERAVENLQQALTSGFTNLDAIRTERDFDPIRQDEKFIAFMKYAAQLIKS